MLLSALLLSWSLAGAAPEPATPVEPVAVAPFRDLQPSSSLSWLSTGAAETVTADLRRAGVRVVERSTLAAAFARVEREANAGGDVEVARAVAAGRLVGAQSLVLGSYQTAGSDLRIVARIVDVSTGVVAQTAKATGKTADVFAVQDQLVALLLKRAGKAPAQKRKARPKLAAYAAYAQSLDVVDDGERAERLRAALALDATFVYAKDDLARIEERLRALQPQQAAAATARETALFAVLRGRGPVDERRAAANALMREADAARRYRALLAAADAILAAPLPPSVVDDVHETAAALRVKALCRLRRLDDCAQAAERHLATFPAGAHRAEVEAHVRDVVSERRSEPTRRQEFAAELLELAEDTKARKREGRFDDDDADHAAFKPCIAAKWSLLPEEMLARCGAYLTQVERSPAQGSDQQDRRDNARAYRAWAYALRGDFASARSEVEALERARPGVVDSTGLRDVIEARWSTD